MKVRTEEKAGNGTYARDNKARQSLDASRCNRRSLGKPNNRCLHREENVRRRAGNRTCHRVRKAFQGLCVS